MKRLRLVLLASGLLVTLLTACSQNSEAKKPKTAQKPPVAVDLATATSQELNEGIEVTGSLEPKYYADVKTQIPGLIKQVYVTEWVRVRKGQPLAKIDVAESEALVKKTEAGIESARAGLAEAQVAVTRADRELVRVLKLKESGLATQQSVDDTRTEAEAAKARMQAARAQIRVAEEEGHQARARQAKGVVSSPLDGVVALRDVNVGDLASDAAAGKPIFRIVDNRLLNMTVTVPSTDSARVKVGQPLEFTVDSLLGKSFRGRVMFINPELSQTDRSLKVIAEVRNLPEVLKGGLFVKGRIITGSRSNVILLPRQAISGYDTVNRKGTVFVLDGSLVRARQVTTGTVSGDLVEIASGVKGGEKYVARGGFNLKDGDRVAVASERK